MISLRKIVEANNFVILDTETTGLEFGSSILTIAIIDCEGRTLLDALVRAGAPIPAEATNVHGITNEIAARGAHWVFVRSAVASIIKSKTVLVYNAPYDTKMLYSSDDLAGTVDTDWKKLAHFVDVMVPASDHFGQWDDYHGNYRWQRLAVMCDHMGIAHDDYHSALGDCRATLKLLRALIKSEEFQPDTVE